MEKPNFDSKEYRDKLADDLKEMKKTDPEMAQTVLSEEKNTTRYKIAEDVNSEKRPERVEFFKELRNSIKEGDLSKYFEYKKSKELYKKETLAEDLHFSQGELKEMAKDFIINDKLKGAGSLVLGEEGSGTISNYEIKSAIEGFLIGIGYKPAENKETNLFILNELLKKNIRKADYFGFAAWQNEAIEPETALAIVDQANPSSFAVKSEEYKTVFNNNNGMAWMEKDGKKIQEGFSKEFLTEFIKNHPNSKIHLSGRIDRNFNLTFIFSN
ncbi:hypothetical protein A2995_00405 [Candidatus Nomurabacteria bacterium RIFCSPLOWO2_01_FULL_33_24]|uniref:Uncharacterized protein n=1 Tax=Candidatus Nomurabacteria bacterium RIFCSPLOWO2_01_FULL_33_24 TaxID=1801765 RepID=A0A1F6WYR3_9BACT|nr:MAG: hypothetical protein A2995_00405 [Candidatus Nomurabacteria bacterium RIFCSPLOWO2_01_FULL_33_24]